ncbi:hypothetical protein LOD99_14082 [Oopsacas minuta]|uniref:Hint domain-containing protein n=1 Tax=Oopsacas minuta TaxID=111878 RepID=A0AAV7KH78_9METZ|nr:hypothetical protein LOD99_14082 [Oopsacas minuta]
MAAKSTSDIVFVPFGGVPSQTGTPGTTTWLEGRKDGEEGNIMPLPRTIYEANTMYVKNINHPAMNMMGSSLKSHRSCNEAIIYLYGVSGAGKSSTLNHLFNRENMVPVSSSQSCTSEVCEYVSTMESDHWKVSNLQIGFIDTPGWDDTRSKDMDAFNFALMESFISTHPHLGCRTLKIYPNIILIVIRAVDNRLIGENAKTSQMLRAISQLDIVDTERPNVVFILTHAWAIPERKYSEESKAQKERLKQLSREFLGVTPPVVMIENNLNDNNLTKCGDFTLLRDGNKQPLNLYNAMKKLMKGCNDEIGIEAVRIFFGSRHLEGNVEKRYIMDEDRVEKKYIERCKAKWADELNKNLKLNKTEVALILEKFIRERKDDIIQQFPKVSVDGIGFLGPLSRVLESYNIQTFKELQKSYKQILKQKKCPLNNVEKYILLNVLEIDTTIYSEESLGVIGKGYECFCEILAPKEVFKPVESDKIVFNSTLVKKIPIRYAVTECKKLEVSYGKTSLIRSDYYSIANVRKYKESNEHFGFMEGFYFGVEEYIFTIALDFKNMALNPEFCKDIEKLPNEWENSDGNTNTDYREFFKSYGYWVIIKGRAGGFLQGSYKPPNRNMPIRDIQVGIEGYIERLKSVNTKNWNKDDEDNPYGMLRGIEHSSIQWLGGNTDRLPDKFGDIKPYDYLQWLESVSDQPVIFEHSLTTIPIHVFVRLVNSEKGDLVKNAFNIIYPDSANISYNNQHHDIAQVLNNFTTKIRPVPPSKPKRYEDSFIIIESNTVISNPACESQQEKLSPIPPNENKLDEVDEVKTTPKIPIRPPKTVNPLVTPNRPNHPPKISVSLQGEPVIPQSVTSPQFFSLRPPVRPKPKLASSFSTDFMTASQGAEKQKSYANVIIGEHESDNPLNRSNSIPLTESPVPEPLPRRSVTTKKNVMNKLEEQLKRSSTLSERPPMKLPQPIEDWKPIPSPRGTTKQTQLPKPQLVSEHKVTAHEVSVRDDDVVDETADDKVIDEDTREGQSIKSKRRISQDSGCFPGHSKVVLKGGAEISIDNLKQGDYVLSIDRKSLKPIYSKVHMWSHMNPTATGDYIHIHYRDGILSLTPNHLLLCSQFGDSSVLQLMPARDVGVGDKLYHVKPNGKEPCIIQVVKLSYSQQANGYYSPVTYNSMIIVDGVACSVWSLPSRGRLLESCHTLGHWLFSPYRMADTLGMERLFKHNLDEKSGKHMYCIFLEKLYLRIRG